MLMTAAGAELMKKTSAWLVLISYLFTFSPVVFASDTSSTGGGVTKPGNYLQDSSNCNGILSTAEEIGLLRAVDGINADYVAGKVSESQRGTLLNELVEKASRAKADSRASGFVRGKILQRSQNVADMIGATYGISVLTGHPLTSDQKSVLKKLGVKPAEMESYVKQQGERFSTSIHAFTQAGATYNPSRGWDFSNTHFSPQQIADDPYLSSAFGQLLSPSLVAKIDGNPFDGALQTQLTNVARKNAVFFGSQVFLPPPTKSENGKLVAGEFETVSVADYQKSVNNDLNRFKKAAARYLSASRASTTVGNMLKETVDESKVGRVLGLKPHTDALSEENEAYQEMLEAENDLRALGYPSGSPESPMSLVYAAAGAVLAQDGENINRSIQALEKLEKAGLISGGVVLTAAVFVSVATLGTAGVAAGAAVGGGALALGEVGSAGATAATAAEAAADTAILTGGAAVTGETAGAVELAVTGDVVTAEGAAGASALIRFASAASRLGTAFAANMKISGFVFPAVMGAVMSGAQAYNDNKYAGGGFSCRFASELSGNAANLLLMENFAFAGPLAGIFGEGTAILTGAANSAKYISYAELGSAAAFVASMIPSVRKEKSNCKAQLANAQVVASKNDNAISADTWRNAKSVCIQEGVDIGFAALGGFGLAMGGFQAFKATDTVRVADPNAPQAPVTNLTPEQQQAFAARASSGNYQAGETIFDKSGSKYTVLRSGVDEVGPYILALKSDHSGFVRIPQSDVDNANTMVVAGKETPEQINAAVAEAQALAAKSEEAALADDQGTSKSRAKSDPEFATTLASFVEHLKQANSDLESEKRVEPLGPDADLTLQHIAEELHPQELTALEVLAEKDPARFESSIEQARTMCTLSYVKNEWDPGGVFRGILYAENEAGCPLY